MIETRTCFKDEQSFQKCHLKTDILNRFINTIKIAQPNKLSIGLQLYPL